MAAGWASRVITHNRAQADSTNGYRLEMGALQYRQRPRNSTQERTGTLSHQAKVVPQRGQWLEGQRMDSWRGNRQVTTLRKLPTAAPSRAVIRAGASGMREAMAISWSNGVNRPGGSGNGFGSGPATNQWARTVLEAAAPEDQIPPGPGDFHPP